MCIQLFAVLIKFSLSVEHFPHVRERKAAKLDFFLEKYTIMSGLRRMAII